MISQRHNFWSLLGVLLLGPAHAQDSLVTYNEGAYEFQCPSSWERDNRGADPLFYLPDSTGEIDRSVFFSIIDQRVDEEEQIGVFTRNHVKLSEEVWQRYGSAVSYSQDTGTLIGGRYFWKGVFFLEDFNQWKFQWFLKVSNTVYIFELTEPQDVVRTYEFAALEVMESFRVIQR